MESNDGDCCNHSIKVSEYCDNRSARSSVGSSWQRAQTWVTGAAEDASGNGAPQQRQVKVRTFTTMLSVHFEKVAFRNALQFDAANVLHHILEFVELERFHEKGMGSQIVRLFERSDVRAGQDDNRQRGRSTLRPKPTKNVKAGAVAQTKIHKEQCGQGIDAAVSISVFAA